MEERGWPQIAKERKTDRDPGTLGDLLGLLRNSVAHGNVEFLPDGHGEIQALRLWNIKQPKRQRTWGSIITVSDVRKLLGKFVDLIEERHREHGGNLPISA